MRLTFKFLTKQLNIIGLANGYGGRHLGCEEAVKVLKNSSIFKECKVPYKWNSIIEETVTGRSVNALEGIIKVCYLFFIFLFHFFFRIVNNYVMKHLN